MSDATQEVMPDAPGEMNPPGGGQLTDPLAEALERLSDTSGVRKVAIALLAMGQDLSRTIIGHLDADDIERVLRVSDELKDVPAEEVAAVLQELTTTVERGVRGVAGHHHRIRRLAEEALGRDTLTAILGRDSRGAVERLEQAAERDAVGFGQVISREHPQLVSVVLSMMSPDVAAPILKLLPESMKTDVIRRIATMGSVRANVLTELAEIVGRELKPPTEAGPVTIDGRSVAVGLLKKIGREEETLIFEGLHQIDEELATELESKMFIFEDLLNLDDRTIQMILREVDKSALSVGLKTASKRLKTHILSNMSSNAAMLVVEDMEVMAAPKQSAVDEAQDSILAVVLRLADEGKVTIRGDD